MHRDDLMHACEPGRRPYAWWRFDASVSVAKVPTDWGSELIALLERGAISADEAVRLEAAHRELQPDCRDWGSNLPEGLLNCDRVTLGGIMRKFEAMARWHAFRGRPELAAVYQDRAGRCAAAPAMPAKLPRYEMPSAPAARRETR